MSSGSSGWRDRTRTEPRRRSSPGSIQNISGEIPGKRKAMAKILVTGGGGMVGRAVRERLPDAIFLTRQDCNLEDASAVRRVFGSIRPTVVIHAAALVGGIKINAAKPYDFFTRNVTMNSNVTDAALAVGVDYLVAVSSA